MADVLHPRDVTSGFFCVIATLDVVSVATGPPLENGNAGCLSEASATLLARTPVASAVLLALASPAADGAGVTTTLGEVIVTAQKRSENLQDVPISVEA